MANKLKLEPIVINGKTFIKPKKWIKNYLDYGYIIPKDYTFLINRLVFMEHKVIGKPKEEQIIPVFLEPHDIMINEKRWRVCPINPFIHVTEEGEFGYIERDNFGKEKGFRYMGFGKNNTNSFYKYKTYKTTIHNKAITYNIHKLIASAFIPNDNYFKYYFVDHVNGNKEDNRACNLKWTSLESNTAKQFDFLKGNVSEANYLVRNIDTGEIRSFISKNDISLHYKSSRKILSSNKFEKGQIFVFKVGRFEILPAANFQGWAYDKRLPNGNMAKPKFEYKFWAKNLRSGDITYHESAKDFSFLVDGLVENTIRERIKIERLRKFPIGDFVIKLNKEDPWPDELPDFDRDCKTMAMRKREMVVVSVDNKERYEFASMLDMCKHFKIDHKAVRAYIKEDKPFKRLDKEWKVNFKE